MKKLFFIVCLLSGLSSCIEMSTEVDADQLEAEAVLVVHSFISPQDTLIRVAVSESVPRSGIIDADIYLPKYVEEATVILSNGQDSVRLEAFEESFSKGWGEESSIKSYVADTEIFPIEAGATYYLYVRSKDGREVKAHCTVPSYKPELMLSIEDFKKNDQENSIEVNLKVSWKDLQGEKNQYRFLLNRAIWETDRQSYYYIEEDYYDSSPFYEDEFKDGQNFSVVNSFQEWYMNEERGQKSGVIFHVVNADQMYYEYHKEFYRNKTEYIVEFPVELPSNIKGGAGVFCAYNGSSTFYQFGSEDNLN
jgi:hypothetical protein